MSDLPTVEAILNSRRAALAIQCILSNYRGAQVILRIFSE